MKVKGGGIACALVPVAVICLVATPGDSTCPRRCACYVPTEVHCTFRYLTSIPDSIPPEVERVNLGYNSLVRLTEADFAGLSKLELLMLHSNGIHTIPAKAFSDLQALQVLKMSYNKVRKLQKDSFYGLRSLTRLHMDHNNIEFINPEAFYGLTFLRLVHLEGNRLTKLHPDTFVSLRYLQIFKTSFIKYLYLSDNFLSSLPQEMVSYMPDLESLYLHGNPWTCDCHLKWLSDWMQEKPDIIKCKKDRSPSSSQQCPLCMNPRTSKGKPLATVPAAAFLCVKPTIDPSLKLKSLTFLEDSSSVSISPQNFMAPFGSLILNMTDQSGNEANMVCSIQKPSRTSSIAFTEDSDYIRLNTSFSTFLMCNIDYSHIQPVWQILALYSDSPLILERSHLLTETPQLCYQYKQVAPKPEDIFTNIEAALRADPPWLMQDQISLQLNRTATTLSTLQVQYSSDAHVTVSRSEVGPVGHKWTLIPRDNNTKLERTVLVGGTIDLDCPGQGDPAPHLEWLLADGSKVRAPYVSEDGRILIDKSGKLELQMADSFDTGIYSCISTNDADADVLAYRVTVVEPHVEPRQENGAHHTVFLGEALDLPCRSTGVPDASVSWVLPGNTVLAQSSGEKQILNGTLRILRVTQGDQGHYRCVAANPSGVDVLINQVSVQTKGPSSAEHHVESDGSGLGEHDPTVHPRDPPAVRLLTPAPTGAEAGEQALSAGKTPGHRELRHRRRGGAASRRFRGPRRQLPPSARRIDPRHWAALLEKAKKKAVPQKQENATAGPPPPATQPLSVPSEDADASGLLPPEEELMVLATEVPSVPARTGPAEPQTAPDGPETTVSAGAEASPVVSPHLLPPEKPTDFKLPTTVKTAAMSRSINPTTSSKMQDTTNRTVAPALPLRGPAPPRAASDPGRGERLQSAPPAAAGAATEGANAQGPGSAHGEADTLLGSESATRGQQAPGTGGSESRSSSFYSQRTQKLSTPRLPSGPYGAARSGLQVPRNGTASTPLSRRFGRRRRVWGRGRVIRPQTPVLPPRGQGLARPPPGGASGGGAGRPPGGRPALGSAGAAAGSPPSSPPTALPKAATATATAAEPATLVCSPSLLPGRAARADAEGPAPITPEGVPPLPFPASPTEGVPPLPFPAPPAPPASPTEGVPPLPFPAPPAPPASPTEGVPPLPFPAPPAPPASPTEGVAPLPFTAPPDEAQTAPGTPAAAPRGRTLPHGPGGPPAARRPRPPPAYPTRPRGSRTDLLPVPTAAGTPAAPAPVVSGTPAATPRPQAAQSGGRRPAGRPSPGSDPAPGPAGGAPVPAAGDTARPGASAVAGPGLETGVSGAGGRGPGTLRGTGVPGGPEDAAQAATSPAAPAGTASGRPPGGPPRPSSTALGVPAGPPRPSSSALGVPPRPSSTALGVPPRPSSTALGVPPRPSSTALGVPAGPPRPSSSALGVPGGPPRPSISALGVPGGPPRPSSSALGVPGGPPRPSSTALGVPAGPPRPSSSALGVPGGPPRPSSAPAVPASSPSSDHAAAPAPVSPDPHPPGPPPTTLAPRSSPSAPLRWESRVGQKPLRETAPRGRRPGASTLPPGLAEGPARASAWGARGAAAQGGFGRTPAREAAAAEVLPPEPPSRGVFGRPRVAGGAAGLTAPAGSDALLPCAAVGEPVPAVRWTRVSSGLDLSTGKHNSRFQVLPNGTLSIRRVGIQDRGQYLCSASNPFGKAHLHVTLSVVSYPPRILGPHAREVTAHSGSTVELPCRAEGRPAPTVSWVLANLTAVPEPSQGSGRALVTSDGTLVLHSVSVYDRGFYKCVASNSAGQDSLLVKVQVIAAPPVILEQKRQVVAGTWGASLKLPCTATGTPQPRVRWVLSDGTEVKPLQSAAPNLFLFSNGTLHIRNVASSDRGTYECIATSSTGSDRRVVILTMAERETIPRIEFASQTWNEVNLGDKLLLNCSAVGEPKPKIIWRLPSKAVVDQWHRMGSRIHVYPNGSLFIGSITEKDGGDYLCVARNKIGDDLILMHVSLKLKPAKIDHKQHLKTQVFHGKDFQVDCKASGSPVPQISWSLPDGTTVHAMQAGGGGRRSRRYTLFDNGTLYFNKVGIAEEGDYTCYAQNPLGRDEMKVHLTVITAAPRIRQGFKATTRVWAGDTAVLDCEVVGEPKPKVFWLLPSSDLISSSKDRYTFHANGSLSVNDVKLLDSGEYVCVARNPSGDDTKMYKLDVVPRPPVINGLYTNKTVIQATAVRHSKKHFNCKAEGTPPPHVTWIMPDNILLPAPYYGSRVTVHRNGTLEIRNVRRSDSAEFTCVARNAGGESVLVVRLEVLEMLRRPTFRNPFNEKIVAQLGKPTALNCSVDGNPPPEIVWMLPNGTRFPKGPQNPQYLIASNGSFMIYKATREDAGKYRCGARNKVGYIEKLIVLEIGQKPVILTNALGTVYGISGDSLALHCVSDGSPKPNIKWTVPSGHTLDRPQISGKYILHENGTLVIKEATAYDRGNYICKAQNSIGHALITVPVVVVAYPPRITKRPPRNILARTGAAVRLHCVALGVPKPEVTWEMPDHSLLSVADEGRPCGTGLFHPQGTLVIQNPQTSDSGIYRCMAKNALGSDFATTYMQVI